MKILLSLKVAPEGPDHQVAALADLVTVHMATGDTVDMAAESSLLEGTILHHMVTTQVMKDARV